MKILCSFYLLYGLNISFCPNLQVYNQLGILILHSPTHYILDSHSIPLSTLIPHCLGGVGAPSDFPDWYFSFMFNNQLSLLFSCWVSCPTISDLHFSFYAHLPETGYSRKVDEQSEPQIVENRHQSMLTSWWIRRGWKGLRWTELISKLDKAVGSHSWRRLVLTYSNFGKIFNVRPLWDSLVGVSGMNCTSLGRCHISSKEVAISTTTHSEKKSSQGHKMRSLCLHV